MDLRLAYRRARTWSEDRVRRLAEELGDGWLRIVAPAVLFLAFLPFLLPLIRLELQEPLFGDTAMMQYTAWGIRHGMRLYRDTGSTDGPFIHFTQAIIQIFFGITDRGLRKGDLALQILGSGLIGVLLAPRRGLNRLGRGLSIVSWGAACVAVWLSYYLIEPWSVTTNREAFYSVWGCAGMVALYASGTFSRRGAAVAAFAGGYLTLSMCFGKPTGIIFPCAGALALLFGDPEMIATRRMRIRMALYGAGACIVLFLLALALFGSIRGYFFWSIEIPFVGNKFVWRKDWLILVFVEHSEGRTIAVLSLVVGFALMAWDLLPRRAIGFVISPALHWLSFCAQARGFPHQVVPVYATATTLALVLAAALWERGSQDKTSGILAAVVLALVAFHGFGNLETSPFRWSGDPNQWQRPSNTFCDPEKAAGAFLKEHTKPGDTVFAYTPSPRGDNAAIILFYAERRSASPFHYAPWLDPVLLLPESRIQPNPRELAALIAMQDRTRGIACAAVLRRPPAAIAYTSLDRMATVCPPVRSMLQNDFGPPVMFDDIHVQLRKAK
jgi:hypothetical protein